jgi:hypothetical protein
MRSDHYLHPEFGVLSPTPRFRRELRMACFSVLLGIGIGAAAVIALSRNNDADDAGASHRLSSASGPGEQSAQPVLSYNGQQAAGIEKKVHQVNPSKPSRSTAEAAENEATNAATICANSNSSCGNIPPRSTKPRAVRIPAANDGLPIGRLPVGRPDASAGMTLAAPSASSERAPEHLTADRSEDRARDSSNSYRPTRNKPYKTTRNQNRPRQDASNHSEDRASWAGRELGRAYSLDRSLGQRGFWDWSR